MLQNLLRPGRVAPVALALFAAFAVGRSEHSPATQDAAAAGAQDMARQAAEPVVVFLVRHAEKGDDDARDPSLSAAGRARARGLATTLAGAGVTHLFASEYRRTRATLAPLAEHTGVEVQVVGARDAGALAERVLALEAGSVAVVAGHSNTTPQLTELLARTATSPTGRDLESDLSEDEYGVLFQVVIPPPGRRTGEAALLPKLLELHHPDS